MSRCRASVLLLLSSLAFTTLVTSEPSPAELQFGPGAQQLRQLLQRSSEESGHSNPGRVTGALALYCLFGLFVFSSFCTCVVGLVVTVQWPNPRVCCYHTPHSDIPTSESCGCCALHRLNIGFAVTWLALLVLLVLAFIIYLMAAAAVLAIVHSALAYRLIRQLKASYAASAELQLPTTLESRLPPGLVTGIAVERPLPGVPIPGIPVIDIPMTVAVVEAPLLTHVAFAGHAALRCSNDAAGDEESRLARRSATLRTLRESSAASPGAAGAAGGRATGVPVGLDVPVAAVVDSRVLQRQQQQQEQQLLRPEGSPSSSQPQPRGVFAWGSPGASTSAPGPSEPRAEPSLVYPGMLPSGSAASPTALPAAGGPVVRVPSATRGPSGRSGSPEPALHEMPCLPGSPGEGLR